MYIFYSDPNMKNRVTVVGRHDGKKFSVAVARCSKKDHFVRKVGRTIAEGRLNKGTLYGSFPADPSYTSFIEIAINVASVVSEKGFPKKKQTVGQKIRKAAKVVAAMF
jgi:hypothetical protein